MRTAPSWVDPIVAVLRQRGLKHERSYADSLRKQRLKVVDLADRFGDDALIETVDAMRSGLDVILQPALRDGKWFGRPDILRRVKGSSKFGPWSYEVFDTKLAKETRGGTVLRLALYSDLLGAIQGTPPEYFYVVTPHLDAPIQRYRTDDFSAYFRLLRAQLDAMIALEPEAITDAITQSKWNIATCVDGGRFATSGAMMTTICRWLPGFRTCRCGSSEVPASLV